MEPLRAFGRFDQGGKGYLDLFETKCSVLACTGVKLKKKEIFRRIQTDSVAPHELQKLVADLQSTLKPHQILEQVFASVFADLDGNACSLDRFMAIARDHGISHSAEIFVSIDKARKGSITVSDLNSYLSLKA